MLTCDVADVQTLAAPEAQELADVEAHLQAALDSRKLTALDIHLQQNSALQQAYLQVRSRL